jgi:type IV secretion system protein VirD4
MSRAAHYKERAAAQTHFLDLCHLLDEPTPAEVDPTGKDYGFEVGASKTTGGSGFADVFKRNYFALEYKGTKANLDTAFAQLQRYAVALDNPPLLIVSDIGTMIRIHTNWTNSVSKVYEIAIADLEDPEKRGWLKAALSDPNTLRPIKTRQQLTEEVASDFARLARSLRARGHAPDAVAHFINRLVFCMFAEDVKLLPDAIFTQMLERALEDPEEFESFARDLFAAMKGLGGRIGFTKVAWFNGGLFDDDSTFALTKDEIMIVHQAALQYWGDIDPSILGTLFERGLDPDKRSQLGAHYTDRDKIGLRRPSNPLGDASFQDAAALRRAGWFRRRGTVMGRFGGRLLRCQDERHHLVIGPTRSGKGVGYVIPNALMHQGSMIVTDLKGEIFESTAGYRASTGSDVFLFAAGAERSHRYNPLDFIRTDRGNRTTDIQNIATQLIPESADSENAIWQATAQQVIAGAISYVGESACYAGRRNLGEVNAFFNSGLDVQEKMRQISQDEPELSRFTIQSFNAYIALSERTAASALLDVQKALRPFKNERIAAATAASNFDLRALGRRATSIYLVPSIADITLLKPLLSLFVQQALDVLTITHDPRALPVYFLLDEFRQLKKMTEITTKLPYVASHNIKFAIIVQDLKSLDEIYGEAARQSLLGNCGYQLVLGANDQATAEYVSRALGKKTIRYKSMSRSIELMGLHRRTEIEQIRERDLMMAQEVRQMPMNRIVLLVEGQKPIYAHRLRYFKHSAFARAVRRARSNMPDVPRLALGEPAAGTAAPSSRAGAREAAQNARGTAAGQDHAKAFQPSQTGAAFPGRRIGNDRTNWPRVPQPPRPALRQPPQN